MPHKVLLTDHYHPTLDEERRVLKGAGIEICDGNGRYKTADDVITPGEDADAIVTQFMPITGDSSAPPSPQGHRPVRDRRGYDRQSAETGQRIMVANVPDDCIDEVSDRTLAPILALV